MSDRLFIAGDFSGIQDYVLNVSALGGGQARRLRARSFYVQLAGEIAAWKILQRFDRSWDALMMGGGGQFLLCVAELAEADGILRQAQHELEQILFTETRGELGLTLAWGRSLPEVFRRKQLEKRRLWQHSMQGTHGWTPDLMSMADLGSPCEICRHQRATTTRADDSEVVQVCSRCDDDTEIGRRLAQADGPEAEFGLLGCRLTFLRRGEVSIDGDVLPRSLRRHVPTDDSGRLLTFEEIADKAQGDDLLGVLKADVDNMGVKVGEIARQDPSFEALRRFSLGLDRFFGERVQHELEKAAWQSIYTIYSGGDDLLLVGPWNVVLDLAGLIQQSFSGGPGREYGLTLSAGIALTPYRLPTRHAVDRVDDLLENRAKAGPKNQCAALGEVWDWRRHQTVLEQAKQIVRWIESGVCGRALIHRLLLIIQSCDPKRAALWAYQVGRNFPGRNAASPEGRELREWGEQVLASLHNEDDVIPAEVSAALRHALIATRGRRD